MSPIPPILWLAWKGWRMLDVCTLRYQALFEVKQIWCQLAQPLTILRRTRCSALTRRCSAGLSCVVVRPFVTISLGLSFCFEPQGREAESALPRWNVVTLDTSCFVVSRIFWKQSKLHKFSSAQCSLLLGWVPLICH